MNPYSYVWNNPLSYVDPLGLTPGCFMFCTGSPDQLILDEDASGNQVIYPQSQGSAAAEPVTCDASCQSMQAVASVGWTYEEWVFILAASVAPPAALPVVGIGVRPRPGVCYGCIPGVTGIDWPNMPGQWSHPRDSWGTQVVTSVWDNTVGNLVNWANADDGRERKWDDPESLRGATPEEVREVIPEGWTERPTQSGGGTRYADPARPGVQVRVMPGNPKNSIPVQRGPYVVVSPGNGPTSGHIPLAGNPTLAQAGGGAW